MQAIPLQAKDTEPKQRVLLYGLFLESPCFAQSLSQKFGMVVFHIPNCLLYIFL